jgi:hypothetical protein
VTKRVFVSVRRCVLSCIGGEWVKILFRLPPNIRYYRRTFGVLLHNGSRVAGETFGQYPVD